MPTEPTLYWDSCVFLSLVNGDADRVCHIEPFLDLADDGKMRIITSTLTVTEVAYGAMEADGALSDDVVQKIDDLWSPASPIFLVDPFLAIAMDARNLLRETLKKRPKLRPFDALHVATARHYGVEEFHTYDDKLLKLRLDVGMKIAIPISDTRSSV